MPKKPYEIAADKAAARIRSEQNALMSGYGGINEVWQIVDRREYPDARPLKGNPELGIPHAKALPGEV